MFGRTYSRPRCRLPSFEVYDTILDSSTHEDPLYLGFNCVAVWQKNCSGILRIPNNAGNILLVTWWISRPFNTHDFWCTHNFSREEDASAPKIRCAMKMIHYLFTSSRNWFFTNSVLLFLSPSWWFLTPAGAAAQNINEALPCSTLSWSCRFGIFEAWQLSDLLWVKAFDLGHKRCELFGLQEEFFNKCSITTPCKRDVCVFSQ